MPVTYEYNAEKNAVMTRPAGLLRLAEIEDYFRRVNEDSTVPKGFVEVVDFDGVEDFEIRYSNAGLVAAAYRKHMQAKRCRGTVFIATHSVGFGIARMLGAVFEDFATVRVVSDRAALEKELAKFNASQP